VVVIDGNVLLPRFACEHSGVARLHMFMNMQARAAAWLETSCQRSINEPPSPRPFEYREVTCHNIRQGTAATSHMTSRGYDMQQTTSFSAFWHQLLEKEIQIYYRKESDKVRLNMQQGKRERGWRRGKTKGKRQKWKLINEKDQGMTYYTICEMQQNP
jgi:hypothetical protein